MPLGGEDSWVFSFLTTSLPQERHLPSPPLLQGFETHAALTANPLGTQAVSSSRPKTEF